MLKALAVVVYFGAGVVSFVMCCSIIAKAWGLFGLVLAIMLVPVAFFAAPFYAGFSHGNWWPAILTYAPLIPCALLYGVGLFVSREGREPWPAWA